MTANLALNMGALRALYRSGQAQPSDIVAMLYDRIRSTPLAPVWISLVPRETAFARARALERDPLAPACPLYGIPFAIKDNIDLAEVPTTAGCPGFSYSPSRNATVIEALVDAGAIPIRKNQSRSICDRAGRDALALRRVLECFRQPVYFGWIEFRVGGGGGSRDGEFRARD